METLLTPEQVAARLNVSRRTVYRWIEQGSLPGVVDLPGRVRRISSGELEKWIKRIERAGGRSPDGMLRGMLPVDRDAPQPVPQPIPQRR